jgi:hypothetical protein
MHHPLTWLATLGTATAALGACTPSAEVTEGRPEPVYEGASIILLDTDLVSVSLAMQGAQTGAEVEAYGRCVAAQYALERDYGFARHVRTIVKKDGQVWYGDAVYLISPAEPEGLRNIDTAAAVADCAALEIPTV